MKKEETINTMKLTGFRKLWKKRTKREWVNILIDAYVKFRQRAGRGNSLTSELKGIYTASVGGGVIILLVEKKWGVLLPLWIIPVAWIAQKVVEVWLAWFDQNKLGIWQREVSWIRKNIDPIEQEKMRILRKLSRFSAKMEDRLKKIESKLK